MCHYSNPIKLATTSDDITLRYSTNFAMLKARRMEVN